MPVNLVIISDW